MPALLALAAVQALVQIAYLGPFILQLALEVGFSLQRSRELHLVEIALGFEFDVLQLAQDDRLVGEGPIIALICKRGCDGYGGGVIHDNRYIEKRCVCPVLSTDYPKMTYGVAEYLPMGGHCAALKGGHVVPQWSHS